MYLRALNPVKLTDIRENLGDVVNLTLASGQVEKTHELVIQGNDQVLVARFVSQRQPRVVISIVSD